MPLRRSPDPGHASSPVTWTDVYRNGKWFRYRGFGILIYHNEAVVTHRNETSTIAGTRYPTFTAAVEAVERWEKHHGVL